MSPRVAMKLHPEGECAMGSNPEGEARGMTPLHNHPRDAISLPPKGSCSNPIVSWFTIQLHKKQIEQIVSKNSSN